MHMDRNLGNSAIAVLDAFAEDDAQRRAEEQAAHERVARDWLRYDATPSTLGDHLDARTWDSALQMLLDIARHPHADTEAFARRVFALFEAPALEATKGLR